MQLLLRLLQRAAAAIAAACCSLLLLRLYGRDLVNAAAAIIGFGACDVPSVNRASDAIAVKQMKV